MNCRYLTAILKSKLLEQILFLAVCAWIIVFILKTFLLSAYKIPSESMLPNIWPGDWVCVDKFGYGNMINLFGKEWQTPKIRSIKRGDIMVFHFPEGDSVFIRDPAINYYDKKRWSIVNHQHFGGSEVVSLPLTFRIPYLKRCVGLPGDSLQVKNGHLIINNNIFTMNFAIKRWYHIYFRNNTDRSEIISQINHSHPKFFEDHLMASLTSNEKMQLDSYVESGLIDSIRPHYETWINPSTYPFLNDKPMPWSWDNYGPVYIPKKGDTLSLLGDNLFKYSRLIEVYENNLFELKLDSIYINGSISDRYVCKKDYYFVMGDNRHNSLDSRNWGLIPADHIIGKAFAVCWSQNSDKTNWKNIRWNRIGMLLRNKKSAK